MSVSDQLALELAWSLWGELGVRGTMHGRHQDWSIDPEPLMVFTAQQADRDPRLRDESIDWCIAHQRYLSRARLRGVLRRVDEATREGFGPFSATLSEHTGHVWPEATEPWAYQPTHKSRLAHLTTPALVRLRLRALFGVGARAEILHQFVARPEAQVSAAELARLTGYTKRNVTEELDRLELAGLLQVAAPTNQFLYRLHDRARLLEFAGSRPAVFPAWEPLLRVVAGLLDVAGSIEKAAPTVQAIELEKGVAALKPDIQAADLPLPPADRERAGRPEPLESWALSVLRGLASGSAWRRQGSVL